MKTETEMWTLQRLIDRVTTAIKMYAAAAPIPPLNLIVPVLIPAESVTTKDGKTIHTPARIETKEIQFNPHEILATIVPGIPGLEPMQVLKPLSTYQPPISIHAYVGTLEKSDFANFLSEVFVEQPNSIS